MDILEKIRIINDTRENNTKGQRVNLVQTVWNQCMGNFPKKIIPGIFLSKMSPLPATHCLNDETIIPEYTEKSYVQEKKSIDTNHLDYIIFGMPSHSITDSKRDSFIKSHLKSHPLGNCQHYFGSNFNKMEEQYDKETTIENVYNLQSNIMCKNKIKSTMECHSMSNVHEIENLNNISNNSCPTEIDLQKCMDTVEDMLDKNSAFKVDEVNEDAKSFLIFSHSDVPEPIKKASISARLSGMCRDAWNSLTTPFYCRTNSVESEKSVKRPSYLLKRHRRRKANTIAMGRGRGRDRCQLRRSGVSQTRHRKERTKRDLAMIIEVDYKIYRNDTIQYCELQNDHSLNDESNLDDMDGYDVPDGALLVKRTNPAIFSSSDITPMKQESQTSEEQETMKHSTKVRYIIDPSIKNNKDCNKKTSDTEESLSRSRLLSVSSVDSEDSFIVFEASDDELSRQQYSTEIHYTLDSSMKTNEDCNNEIYDTHGNPFRSRLLSECSVDSEDSFIIFKDIENESPKKQETMKCPTRVRYVIDSLTKINNSYHKDCNETYNAQKNTLRPRLCSESSVDSEDSLIIFEGSDDESSKQESATEESTDIHDVSDSSTINNDDYKDYNNKKYMHEDSFQCSENSEDTEDSFCIVFNTELEDNCATDNFNYIKTSTPTFMQEDESMIENDEDSKKSQTKKVIKNYL